MRKKEKFQKENQKLKAVSQSLWLNMVKEKKAAVKAKKKEVKAKETQMKAKKKFSKPSSSRISPAVPCDFFKVYLSSFSSDILV